MHQIGHEDDKNEDASKHKAQKGNIRWLHSVIGLIKLLFGFGHIVIAELLGVDMFNVISNWHNNILIGESEIIK